MRLLRLLSRVAFICNICFLLISFIQWLPNPPEGLASMFAPLGYILAILVNTVVNVWVIVLFLFRKLKTGQVPAWLLIINFIFFAIQLTLLIINRP